MIRLDNINRKLQISLSSVVTTSQLSVNVSYSDKTPTDYIGSTQISTTNNTTSVDICTAPASSITRDIDFLSVYNADTVSATVNIIYNDNAITSILHKVTLNPTDKLVFVHGSGWQTIDSTGNLKTSGSTGATGPSGPAGLVGATGAGVVWMIEGEDGDIGPPGPRGVIGPQGITGSSMVAFSVPGMDGEDGDMGSPGPQGITGNIGIQGPQGNQGPIVMYDIPDPEEVFIVPGPTGIQGPQGSIGPAGPTGNSTVVQGFEGDDGENGDIGPPGPRGTTGITGAQGPQGPQGPATYLQAEDAEEQFIQPGPQGITGPQGIPGTNGTGGGGSAATLLETVDWIEEGMPFPPGNNNGLIFSGTLINTTSGTSINFTGLPSGIKRITIGFIGVSTNGSSIIIIQLGAGSVTATGYLGCAVTLAASFSAFNTGFAICGASGAAAASVWSGQMILSNIGNNNWTESSILGRSDAADVAYAGGRLALGGALDRVRLTTVNGTDTFDAGSINILYEF